MRKILLILGIITLCSFASNINSTRVSWYGEPFHGRTTANGEKYDMNKKSCASPTLPFNTKVEITNLDTGKSIIVRVNDRGPYKMDKKTGKVVRPLTPHLTRGFDLSKAALDSIAHIDKGVINVTYKILN